MSVDQSGAEISRANLFYNPELASEQAEEESKEVTGEVETEEEELSEDSSPDSEEETYTVKVDGEEIEVSLEQMRDSFAGVSAIQKGLRENADERKSLSADRQALIEDNDILLGDDLDFLESEEMQELKSDNPDLYYKFYNLTKNKVDRLKKIKEKQGEETKKESEADIEEKRRELLALIPEWANSEKAKAEGELAVEIIRAKGWSAEKINAITDPVIVSLARDAAMYRKIMSAKPKDKEVKLKPKSSKPGNGTNQKKEPSFAERFYS